MPAPEAKTIRARHNTTCKVCLKGIGQGELTSHRAGFGWVHPACLTAKPASTPTPAQKAHATMAAKKAAAASDSADWSEFDDAPTDGIPFPPTTPDDALEAATRRGMGLPAQKSEPNATSEAIEAKLFAELKRAMGDQARLVKSMVKGEMADTFTNTLPELLGKITEQVKVATGELVKAKLEEARREFKGETARAIAKIAGSGLVRQVIELKKPDGTTTELSGEVFHPRFAWILKLAQAGKPIFLPGPTGCGKTHMAMQVARALHGDKWEEKFGVLSCSPATAERHFLGRSIPNITTGEDVYRAADFVRLYEEGGVFCLDEMDAADPSVLLTINSALANGRLPVPDRQERPIARKHADFVMIGCANTFGRGADRRYVGRNPLDEATLDRFRMGTVPVGYSPAIERALCPDTDLYDTLVAWREAIFTNRLERVLSSRFMRDSADMIAFGASMADIERAFFSGWRKEEVIKVLGRELGDDE